MHRLNTFQSTGNYLLDGKLNAKRDDPHQARICNIIMKDKQLQEALNLVRKASGIGAINFSIVGSSEELRSLNINIT